MRPASTRLLQALAASHEAAVIAEILHDAAPVAQITTGIDGTVTLDQSAQIRGRLDIEIIDNGALGLIPEAAGDLLAPYGNEIRAARGVRYPDGTVETCSLGVFRIDDADVQDTGDRLAVRISGLDRSARLIDARFEEPYQVPAGTNYGTALLDVFQAAWPDIPTSLTATTRTTPALIAEEGSDRWQFGADMMAALGRALYFDGDGVLVNPPVGAIGQAPVATLAEGAGGILVQAARRWTRQGAYNRVIATGENTGEAAPSRGVATDENPASPTYYFGAFGKVPRFYASPFITTDDQAQDAAAAILSRELGTTQSIDFGAVVNPALEPDDVVRITRERAGIDEDHVIDSLTIPLSASGAMSGRTRALAAT